MNEPAATLVSEHQIARDEIDAWRGRCIDLYARGERAIANTLICAQSKRPTVKLSPMAGPRFAQVQELVSDMPGTPKQRHAAKAAIDLWCQVEPKRAFLAHAELTPLLDGRGIWHACFDLTRFKSNTPIQERWVLNKKEADAFEGELKAGFKSLSSQLGQLRKGF